MKYFSKYKLIDTHLLIKKINKVSEYYFDYFCFIRVMYIIEMSLNDTGNGVRVLQFVNFKKYHRVYLIKILRTWKETILT